MGKMKEFARKREFLVKKFLFSKEDTRKDQLFKELNRLTDTGDVYVQMLPESAHLEVHSFMGEVSSIEADEVTLNAYSDSLGPITISPEVANHLKIGDLIEGKAAATGEEVIFLDVTTIISYIYDKTKDPDQAMMHMTVNPKHLQDNTYPFVRKQKEFIY